MEIVVGIDEVGRGCWAGPLVAGAVILGRPIIGLRDSKKLSKKQRECLAAQIHTEALAVGLGWVWPDEIDISGITAAVKLAMERALQHIPIAYNSVIIDGNYNFLRGLCVCDDRACMPAASCRRITTLVRADDSVPAVSAASIAAKVARDRYMSTEAAGLYPGYGFEQHVGYGTARHLRMLHSHGVTKLHRQSYKPIQALLQRTPA